MLTIGLLSASRVAWRVHREGLLALRPSPVARKRVLIVGAGRAGAALAKDLLATMRHAVEVIGFVDDDPDKQGSTLLGLKVLGTTRDLAEIPRRRPVDQVIVAIPSAPPLVLRRIAGQVEGVADVRVLPSDRGAAARQGVDRPDAAGARGDLPEARRGRPGGGRASRSSSTGKTVLVTGAGGSIGGELARQIAQREGGGLRRLVLLDCAETPLYEIERQVSPLLGSRVSAVLASVRDLRRMADLLRHEKPDVVLHAAALKHVPMCELHPLEAIATNTWATARLADLADEHGVANFTLVSTDKAVAPACVMGASKRAAENHVQSLARGSLTRFAVVRFGNVLGSNGSVLPLFHEQIAQGRAGHGDRPARDALLHDHPRGLRPHPPGHAHRAGRRDLRPRHGGARARARHRPQPHPPLRLRAGAGHRGPDHRPAARREAAREPASTPRSGRRGCRRRSCSASAAARSTASGRRDLLAVLEWCLEERDEAEALRVLQALVPGFRPRAAGRPPRQRPSRRPRPCRSRGRRTRRWRRERPRPRARPRRLPEHPGQEHRVLPGQAPARPQRRARPRRPQRGPGHRQHGQPPLPAIAEAAGAEVPFLRPAALADDLSTDLEVFVHALEWLDAHEGYRPEACVHLRPTHPTRRVSDVERAVDLLLGDPAADSVRSVVKAPHTPYKMWRLGDGGHPPAAAGGPRSRGLEPAPPGPPRGLPAERRGRRRPRPGGPRAALDDGRPHPRPT